jgi:hypothetical protein
VYVPKATDNQSIQPYFFVLLVLSFTSFLFVVALAAFCCFEEKSIRVNLMRQGFIPFHMSHHVFVRTYFDDSAGEDVHVLIVAPSFTK